MNRIAALDGLRGLAALAVVFSHVAALSWIPWHSARSAEPWEWALWHLGAPAVDLFFVLSGFVVARSAATRPLGDFLRRRAARLLPVALLGVVLGLAVIRPLGAGLGVPGGQALAAPLTALELLTVLSFLIPFEVGRLNPPLWTLVVEAQATLLMPLFARIRNGLWLLPVALFGSLLAASGLLFPLFVHTGVFVLFALGAWLSRLPAPRRGRAPLFALGLALLLSRHLFGIEEGWWRLIAGGGAALLIMAVQGGVGAAWLSGSVPQFLGRVSYPLYATHYAALFVGAALTPVHLPLGGLLVGVPLALVLAAAVTRVVEEPLLRYLTRKNSAKVSLAP